MIRRTCAISRLFNSTFSPPLSLWHLRLFFTILLCISFTATALSAARLLTARFLSQQPFLHLGTLICCAVGLIRCRGNNLPSVFCTSHTSKRLRQATLCASVAVTLSTLASLPTPTSVAASTSNSDVAHLDIWLLLALTLCVQVFLPGGRARHLVCAVIALAHAVILIVTRFTSSNPAILNGSGGVGGGECLLCWNSCDVQFWRRVASNLVAFTLTNLIGWHLSCQNYLERWRCLCVVLHAAARQSTLCSTQKKLNRISRAIVPPALTTDLEHDFYSPPYVWSSPLVIYLRNVSFLNAELVGFYTSNGSGCVGGGFSPMLPNTAIPEVERYPQPASQHVVTFTNHLVGQIKALCENHGCYAVHVRPGEVLCIAGYPEVRVDHANSCVQLALAINRLLRSLSNAARIQLEARMAIHTGEAYAAVLGQSALTFDLLGADVFHLRRHLRAAAKPGRVLVSRATFDQLPEGYEGELGPTVVDPSTNRHVVHCETLYVQPRKSADTSVSSTECLDSRWPNLGESISAGGLAQAFARLAHQVTLESAESSASAETSTLISILRQMRLKEEGIEGEDEVTACLKGLCDHRCLPILSTLTANSSIKALEFRLLPSPSSSLLIALCHNLPSSVNSFLHPLLPSPPLSTQQNSSSTSSSLRCKHGSCEDLQPAPTQCNSCPAQFLGPSIDALCPLAEAVLWNRLFLRRHQLKVLRNSLAWMVLLLLLLGLTGGLLVTRVSFALIVYPCVITWCLLLLATFSIRRLDDLTCFPVTLRQACVVFTLFLLLASLLFVLMFVSFEVHQPISEFATPWQRTPQLSTTTVLACLSLLLLLTLTPSVPPTPLNSAIVAAIFSGLHITFATTRFIHLPASVSNSSSTFFWTTLLPNSLAAHLVFVLLVCLLPWQTAKLRHWTEQWVKILLEQKVDLTGRRFALEHLLDNQIPRAHLPTEPSNTLAESCTYPSSLSDLFPPREHLATGVIAVAIYGIGKGDDMLQYQRSPIRSVALSQSITTTVTTSSSTASRRSREATVIADAVRRLNRRICLIDQMACGGDAETMGNAVNRIVKSLSKPSLPLVKVHSVGNCVAYALLDADSKDSSSQLGLFAVFLIQLFEELERQCLQKSGEEFRSGDEALACRLQIGLHIGATVSGVVDGPQFLLLHETLDFALRLANATPPTPMDRSLLLASTDFVARRGTESLVGAQPIGVNGGGGSASSSDVFIWTADIQHIPRLIAVLRPVLSTVIQPPVFRNRSKKPLATLPNLEHPRSASSLVNSNSSPPPPPPPHKRNYAVGEARYQNHSSPLLPRRDRKLSSPLLPPRHSSPPSRWALKSVSLDGPGDGDNVDRACFAMTEVEIVNGYAQPTTRLVGSGVTASPYCITKDTSGYANHQSHQPVFEPPKTAIDVTATSITSSDNVFLAVEGACERVEALQSEAVTSLSSASPTTTANTHHHHSNPLYTDNEYYDDEEEEEVNGNIIDGVKQSGDEMSDGCLDAGVEWLQRAPMLGDFSVSVISSGSNFPNYRRPSTPPSNPRQTLYNPPIVAGTVAVADGGGENQRRNSVKLNDKDSTSIDLLSTCVVPSVACDYEFEAGITDFSVNDDEEEDDLEAEMANNSTHAESGDVPLLMDTSWMTSTEGGGGVDGVPSKTPKMSDSLLVETGGPLEDDFSEFSSSAAVAAAATGGDEEGSSSAHLLAAYTSDPDVDGDNNNEEGDDSVFLPPTYFPLIDQSGNHHRRGRRLPDIAPVRLPNFAAAASQHPPSVLTANNQIVKPLSPPLLVDLTCPPSPPPNNASTRVITGGQDMAEYDNLENAYSSAVPTNRSSLRPTPQHGGWRPRDVHGHRRGGLLPRRIDNPYQRHLRLNAHIVDEARRICQRLHAMGWQSALSLQTQSLPSDSSSEDPSDSNRHNEAPPGKTILLLPPPPPPPLPPPSAHPFARTPKRGDYVNSHSLIRRLQGFDSGTVTTVTSQIDDDQLTDDGTFDSEFLEDGEGNMVNGEPQSGSLLIPADLWLDVGRPRSLSNDCLLTHHDSENDDDIDGVSHRSHPRRGGGILARELILRRAANVRQLLPLELQPFMMPGCFSSVSATTTTCAKSGGTAVVSLQRRNDRSVHRRQRGRRRHLLVAVRGGVKRSSSDPLLPCGAAANLDVSLI